MTTETATPQGMTSFLGDIVKDHHRTLLTIESQANKLRDRRNALMAELTQLGPQIAEAERSLASARELLEMSWSHYRQHAETPRRASELSPEENR